MLIKKIYDTHTRTQKAWFDSSMFYYTKMVENEFENKGDLTVVFKNGSTYCYKNVLFEDYMLLLLGGTDASNGKTLNKNIKSKYDFEKLNDTNIQELQNELNMIIEQEQMSKEKRNKTYFISGHRNISVEEFELNYIPILDKIASDGDTYFVVGDYYGVDIMAQNYLMDEYGLGPERITVYHMFDSPRNINSKITNTVGGFQTDSERDSAMTNNSFDDIAFVRDEKKMSGTGENLLRRHKLISI